MFINGPDGAIEYGKVWPYQVSLCNFFKLEKNFNYDSYLSLVFTLEILSKMIMVGMKM